MLNELEQKIEQVEIHIDAARKAVKKMEALDRLYRNKDFKEIITEGYFKDEASRLVLLKGDVNINEESEKHCEKMINGIGCLRAYFQMVNHFGDQALKAMEDDERTREELLTEQLGGGEE
jgi:hypothetical protein